MSVLLVKELTFEELLVVDGGNLNTDFVGCVAEFTLAGFTVGSAVAPGPGSVVGVATGVKVGLGVCAIANRLDGGR